MQVSAASAARKMHVNQNKEMVLPHEKHKRKTRSYPGNSERSQPETIGDNTEERSEFDSDLFLLSRPSVESGKTVICLSSLPLPRFVARQGS